MGQEGKRDMGAWKALKLTGIAISVVGVLIALYSTYAAFVAGPHLGSFAGGNFTARAGGFNHTAGAAADEFPTAYRGGLFSFYPIIIGVLVLIVGLLLFQYSRLKLQTAVPQRGRPRQ